MKDLLPTDTADTVAKDVRDLEVYEMMLAVLRSLVDDPKALHVVPLADGGGVTFQVLAAPDDVGKLIGKGGRTARAVRTILSGNAAKHGRRYSVDFAKGPS